MSTVGEMGATCPRGDETECKDSKERGNSGDRVRGPKSPWSSLSLKLPACSLDDFLPCHGSPWSSICSMAKHPTAAAW